MRVDVEVILEVVIVVSSYIDRSTSFMYTPGAAAKAAAVSFA